MIFDLTDQRKAYIEARGKTILTACPGSGKTASVAYKLHSLIKEWEELYGSYRGVACLSFTNKACSELEEKFMTINGRSIIYPHLISTIDSFITQNVVLPYFYLTTIDHKPTIVNDDEIMHNFYFPGGYPSYAFTRAQKSLMHTYNPEEVNRGKEHYLYKNKKCDSKIQEYAKEVWKYRVKLGMLNSQDVAYIACCIMNNNPIIAESLAQRYPYIIVDEAQDTSELQTLFFDLLCKNGLRNMEYVGDVYQSIYEWRSADPENFRKMMATNSGWNVLPLTENRRSVQRIIDVYSKIRKPGEEIISSIVSEDKGIPILVYKYNNTNIGSVLKDFSDKCNQHGLENCRVLVRGKELLHHLIGTSEKMKYWKSIIPYRLISAILHKEEQHYSSAVKDMLWIKAELLLDKKDVSKKNQFVYDCMEDYRERASMLSMLDKMPPLNKGFDEWTTKAQLELKSAFHLVDDIDFESYVKKKGHNMSMLKNEPVSKYYSISASSKLPVQVETIHSSKGASYGGVLVFLSDNSSGEKISLSELSRKKGTSVAEKQRLLYVACSRAEQFLAFAVPAKVNDSMIISTLGIRQEQICKI